MIGLIIISHGELATEFKNALEHIMGPQDSLITFGINPEDDMEKRREQLLEAVERINLGKGVIVLSDMFGGTPSNLAISLLNQSNVEVLAGVNLPVLVKLASIRSTLELNEAVNEAKEAGRKYINVASQLLDAHE